MQRVDIHKEYIAILIDEFYRLVHLAILFNLDQTAEATHTVVYMHHVVTHLQGIEFRHGHLLVTLYLAIYAIALITVKYLMLGI